MTMALWNRRAGSREPNPLLAAARTGDSVALEQLLTPHEGMLRSLCRGVLGSPDDAEDALQETFLRAIRYLGTYRGDASLPSWLAKIALNVCLEAKRRPRAEALPETNEPLCPRPQPERQVIQQTVLDQALAQLSPRRRALFLLKADGWSLKELSAVSGWPETRVKVELYRSRQALERWLTLNGTTTDEND